MSDLSEVIFEVGSRLRALEALQAKRELSDILRRIERLEATKDTCGKSVSAESESR
jgi:hypothetical protein